MPFDTLGRFWLGRRRSTRRLSGDVIAQLPQDRIRAIQEQHSGAIAKGEHHRKWLNVEFHMQRAARDAIALGLHESEPLHILDIGCGAGYFLAVARHLGHSITGLDKSDNEVFNDFVALMAIPRVIHSITPFAPLPDFPQPFNLITGFEVRFNWKNKRERWTCDEWRYFLNDGRARLAPGGRMRLELNPGKATSYKFLPEETVTRLREVPGVTIPTNKKTITVAA
jgi:cyclopropane fatty-acyl-phospholipid synthase-like methyltransferase